MNHRNLIKLEYFRSREAESVNCISRIFSLPSIGLLYKLVSCIVLEECINIQRKCNVLSSVLERIFVTLIARNATY